MTQLTIDSVQRDFKIWRTSRTKRGHIPDDLWDKTLQLLDHYPISKVIMALRLNGGTLLAKRKQQRETLSKTLPVTRPINFLELNMPVATPCDTRTISSGSRLEIKRADGAILAIEHFTEQTLLQVLNQFTRGSQLCYN